MRAVGLSLVIVMTLTAGLTAGLSVRRARADPATEARIHFRTGVAFIKRGQLTKALERFLIANRLAPNPNIVFNIALCLDRLKRREEAFVYYRELLGRKGMRASDRNRARVAMALILPHVARLAVVTEPRGATIYVDRKALGAFGRTPRVLAVKPGRRRVYVERAGYEPTSAWVSAVKGRQVRVRLRMKQIVGSLRVITAVPGAEIRVNDQTTAAVGRTPHTLSLPPGPHTIFLRAKGYRPSQRRLIIQADKQRQLVVSLTALPPPKGTLRVNTNVMGALVVLDGKNLGITPLLRRDIRAGRHRITVFSEGYYPWSGRFTLRANGRVQVSVQLERVPRRKKRGPWPWIMVGLTGASIVAAITMGGLAASNHKSYLSASAPTLDDLQRGRMYNAATDVLLGTTAAAGLATALTFVFLKPDRDRPTTGRVQVRGPRGSAGATGKRRPAGSPRVRPAPK